VESLEPVGEFYDLGPIAARLNRRYFGGRLRFDITWGRRVPAGRRRRQRQITLGLCHSEDRVIRIHRILDSPDVPLFYLEYVIYHEMAHLAVPSRVCPESGRRFHHTPEFYDLERRYPRYREALLWQNANLDRML